MICDFMGDDMQERIQKISKVCAGCGCEIIPDWIIDHIVCPECEDKLRKIGWNEDVNKTHELIGRCESSI